MNDFYKYLIKSKSEVVESKTEYNDSDLGRALGATQFAVHWMTLKPGQRTSSPHAESIEEEFIYVIKGNPHVWVNGYIYPLTAGHAVGFPAGTGIAHTFINNTNEDIEMVILGERSKKENKCSFPVNPELYEEHKNIWWRDFPKQDFGPHDGKVGDLNHLKDPNDLAFLKSVHNIKRTTYNYPGDSETFTQGIRLTDHTGLKVVGVWHEVLLPGQRTSWPHAHKVEEEFCLILKGNPQVWLNGYLYNLNPGDGVFFSPGTNIAHTIMNNSKENVEYIGIGQANSNDIQDQIYYPLHPVRNLECKEKKYFWEERPEVTHFGEHDGKPNTIVNF